MLSESKIFLPIPESGDSKPGFSIFRCFYSLMIVCSGMFVFPVMAQDGPDALWSESGHADAKAEAFTHWNDDGAIPENCAACHAETGFLDYIGDDGSDPLKVDKEHAIGSVVGCSVCHNDTAKTLEAIPFPSGKEVAIADTNSATCMVCHQGRAATTTVNAKLDGMEDADAVNAELGFINIHYKAAAATLYGTEVQGGYEYENMTYQGKFAHVPGLDSCAGCHNPHSLEVELASCTGCHANSATLDAIRMTDSDFDGDGNKAEGIAMEIQALHKSLGVAIIAYAKQSSDSPILYSPSAYPYFFNDNNANMEADEGEIKYPNRYNAWTPRLLRAAYNYQYVAKDPGAYAHNPKYALQLLYDSLESLSQKIDIDMAKTSRP